MKQKPDCNYPDGPCFECETEFERGLLDQRKKEIDVMSQESMCRLWRFAPSGHPFFVIDTPVAKYFDKRFEALGGFSPEISKKIGW